MPSDSEDVKSPAQIIESLRIERGMTQQTLAERAGYNSTQALSKKLKGNGRFTVPEIITIAEQLEVPPLQILGTAWPDIFDDEAQAHLFQLAQQIALDSEFLTTVVKLFGNLAEEERKQVLETLISAVQLHEKSIEAKDIGDVS